MRYTSLSSFQNHLKQASPNHLCMSYLVLVPDDFERNEIMDHISSFLKLHPERFDSASFFDFFKEKEALSLFGPSFSIVDEVEKLSKKDQDGLASLLHQSSSHLVLGGRGKVSSVEIVVESEGVVLDLTLEKPWDKEKRRSLTLIEKAQKEGKLMSLEASSFLLEQIGSDPASLSSELKKLIAYVGERKEIQVEDIRKVSSSVNQLSLWQEAEKVIWEKQALLEIDASSFYALIPILRNQLHLGLTIATLLEERFAPEKWKAYLPKIFSKTLEKKTSQARLLKSPYFKKGLDALFEMELASRTYSGHLSALLTRFQARLYG